MKCCRGLPGAVVVSLLVPSERGRRETWEKTHGRVAGVDLEAAIVGLRVRGSEVDHSARSRSNSPLSAWHAPGCCGALKIPTVDHRNSPVVERGGEPVLSVDQVVVITS